MVPPKYKFYIGKGLEFTLTEDQHINSTTGAYDTAINTAASGKVPVSAPEIYVDYAQSEDLFDDINKFPAEQLFIATYNKASNYLGPVIITNTQKVYALKEGTAYIALSFTGLSESIMEKHKRFVEKGFNKVFAITEVEPHYKELNKKYAKESEQEFFRSTLDGQITLFGKDFEVIEQSSIEDRLMLFVTKLTSSGQWIAYSKSEFNKVDCKYNLDKKSCQLKLTALDEYTEVLNKYDNTYDLIKLAPALSKIDMCKRPVIQAYIKGSDSIANFIGGTYDESEVLEAVDDADALINKYYFSKAATCREAHIEGAPIKGVNGMYGGTADSLLSANGEYLLTTQDILPSLSYSLVVKRASDDTAIYGSTSIISNIVNSPNWDGVKMIDITNLLLGTSEPAIFENVITPADSTTGYTSVLKSYKYKNPSGVTSDGTTNMSKIVKPGGKITISYDYEYRNVLTYPGTSAIGRRFVVSVALKKTDGTYAYLEANYIMPANTMMTSGKGRVVATATVPTDIDTTYSLTAQNLTAQILQAEYIKLSNLKIELGAVENPVWTPHALDSRAPISFSLDNIFVYNIYTRLLCDVDAAPDGTPTYDLPIDDFVSDNRNYKKCIGLKGAGDFYCSARTSKEPTRFGVNDYEEYFTNKFLPFNFYRPLPVCRNSWVNASIWYVYSNSSIYEIWESQLRKKYTLKNSYSIADIIKVMLREIDPSLTHEATEEYSQFLYAKNMPFSLLSNRFYLYLTPKSNILKGEYDQPAQKAEITFEDLMKMLRDCFRCYWYIDGDKFKIEHIYYFMNGGSYQPNLTPTQLDFTTLKDRFNKRLTSFFQSEVEYDKSELSSRYEFSWMDNATELFEGPVIDVKSNYVQKDKTEEISASQFSSDVDFMLFNPSSFSEDGFALLCPIINDNKALELPVVQARIKDTEGFNYDGLGQNFYASWKFLTLFYLYDMPSANISIENGLKDRMYVTDIKKCKRHSLKFPLSEDPDIKKLILTGLGAGKIEEMSINLTTRQVTTELAYRP